MPLPHRTSCTLPAPRSAVWDALVEPAQRALWLAAEVVEVERSSGGSLALTWNCLGVGSRVEFSLADEGAAATKLEVAHTLERELVLERAAEWLDDHWRLALGNLGALLRHGADLALPRLEPAGAARPIRLVLALEASVADVWSALVEPARLNRWIASAAEVDARAGGAYRYGWNYKVGARDVAGGPRRIVAFEPGRLLATDWPDWRGDPGVPDQRVTWTLAQRPGGTRVELEHAGFAREVDWSDYVQGWWQFLLALRGEVERPASGFALPEALALLERTPRVLRVWLSGLPAGWLRADEGPATYSPLEIVGHFIHGEETDWIPRTRRLLEHGERVPFDRYDRFAQRRLHAGATLEDLLALFERRRVESLTALRQLVPADGGTALDARGRHPILGAVTLRQLLSSWVVHDLSHLRQLARVMAQRYHGEVGPWIEFLPLLSEGPLGKRGA